jgi:hypothetical protein
MPNVAKMVTTKTTKYKNSNKPIVHQPKSIHQSLVQSEIHESNAQSIQESPMKEEMEAIANVVRKTQIQESLISNQSTQPRNKVTTIIEEVIEHEDGNSQSEIEVEKFDDRNDAHIDDKHKYFMKYTKE